MRVVLRDYQETAIDRMRSEIKRQVRKLVFVLPTGGGKSIVFGAIIASAYAKGKSILWLVHRRNLVLQMQDTLKNHFGINAGIIMAGVETNKEHRVQLSTIQTLNRRLELPGFEVPADIVLVDEAHRSVSPTYKQVLNRYSDKIIMGCTATPMRADGRGLGEIYHSIVDITNVQRLTSQGHLAPARYFAPTAPDLEGLRVRMGDYVVGELETRMNKPKLIADVVENWLQNAENRKTICFCVNVKHSIAVCDAFNAAGVPAAHLSARSSDEERALVFERMNRGEIRVVCNVGLYQEGLDVPDVACIVMARPTKSLGLWRQCGGRGLRPSAEHKDCVVFDHAGVIEELGLLEDPVEWTLDGKEVAWKRTAKPLEKKTCKCRVCHMVFEGSKTCPDCGSPVKTFGKPVETVDGELKEIKKANRTESWAEKRRFMGGLVWWEQQKGWNPGRKAHLYRLRYGVWPNDYRVRDVSPIKPEGEVENLIKHIFIKSAKQYQKRA